MRVLLRADAGVLQGTGHVMRCMTLGHELVARGHTVALMTAELAVPWLEEIVGTSGIPVHTVAQDSLPAAPIAQFDPDWVVVDSYRIDAHEISILDERVPVLAIVDGDDRGIRASLYLDQNLGAEALGRPSGTEGRFLAGADYSLVRDAILRERRADPWRFLSSPPTIVSFMGGTDPTGASVAVTRALLVASDDAELVVVAPAHLHPPLLAAVAGRPGVTILPPTPDLPALFGSADLVVSAAGTSAWDVCALGLPAVLVGVVDNQSASIGAATAAGLVLGVDVSGGAAALEERLIPLLVTLLTDEGARRRLSTTCLSTFDGNGKTRVAERMEQEAANR